MNMGESLNKIMQDATRNSKTEQTRRLDICRACDYFRDGRCTKCGCQLRRKVQFANLHCPIDKW